MVWSRRLFLAVLMAAVCRDSYAATVLFDFMSPSCGPCRAMHPVMQKLAAAGFDVREIDTSREPGAGIARKHNVQELPTFVVMVDGKERARLVGGGNSVEKMAEMIHKATAIGQAAGTGVQFANGSTSYDAAPPSASEPQPGRVVPLDLPPPVTRSPANAPATRASADSLISATVRLSIDDSDGKSTGTGTIVDSRAGKALVLTCGHLFRTSGGKGTIEISLFTPGPNGAELQTTVEGLLIDYDLDRDLALVCFAPEGEITVAPLAPLGFQMAVDQPAISVGCEHGANPTAWPTRITALDRYQGTPNIEAAKAPVEGRSGGGLFNAAGQLVGVCNAADPQRDEGLYASLPSIHAKLDALQLGFVYREPSTGRPLPAVAANDRPPFEVRGQSPTIEAPTTTPFGLASAAPTVASPEVGGSLRDLKATAQDEQAAAPLSPQDTATLQEINRRGVEAEVICIINHPGGRSEVIKLNRASPELQRALGSQGAASDDRLTDARVLSANSSQPK